MNAVITLPMKETLTVMQTDVLTTESELIERCKNKDAAAFHELFRKYRTVVFGVVAKLISNESDREEIVQDAFFQIFRSLNSFKGHAKLSTWIHRVTVNVTLQHIRKKGRRIKLSFTDNMPENIQTNDFHNKTPEDDLVLSEREKVVRNALDALPPKKRIALVLSDFQGMTSREIAKVVGVPALTVRTRLFYARKFFYARLSKDPAFADITIKGGKL